jgi:O-antigen ligase
MPTRSLIVVLILSGISLLAFSVPVIGFVFLGLAVGAVLVTCQLSPKKEARASQSLPWKSLLTLTAIFFVASNDLMYTVRTGIAELGSLPGADPGRVEYSPREFAFLNLALLTLVVLYSTRNKRFRLERKWRFLLLGFAGIAFLSALRSDDAVLTLKKLSLLAIFALAAMAYNKRYSLHEIVWFALISGLVVVGVGVAAEIWLGTFNPLASTYSFQGTDLYNFTAWQIATVILAAVTLSGSKSIGHGRLAAILLFAVPLIVLTRSREANYGLLAAILAYRYLVSGRRTVVFAICSLLVLAVGSFVVWGDRAASMWRYVILLGRTAEASTLTGRTSIWDTLIGYATAHPMIGYGYGSFWTKLRIQTISVQQGWVVSDAHSGYLDMVLGVGIVGAAIFVLMQILAIWRYACLYKATHDPDYAFAFAFLIFVQCNMLLASVFNVSNITTFLWILLVIRISSARDFTPATQAPARFHTIPPEARIKLQAQF